MSEVTEFYGRWASLYDAVATRTPGVGTLRATAADALGLERGDTVVDLGCGTGANFPHLRKRVGPEGTVVGVDLTPGMLVHARERARRWENVHVARGDAARPPVESVDGVLASFVVGLLDDPQRAVEEWCEVTTGGRVVLVDAAPSARWGAWPLNLLCRAVTVLGAPPTAKLHYERSPGTRLRERVATAEATLDARASETTRREYFRGVVRVVGGTVQ